MYQVRLLSLLFEHLGGVRAYIIIQRDERFHNLESTLQFLCIAFTFSEGTFANRLMEGSVVREKER